MSYGPTPVALGAITLPNNGQPVTAESVNVALEAIADGVKAVGVNHIHKADFWPVTDVSPEYYGSATTTTFTEIEPGGGATHPLPFPIVELTTAALGDRLLVQMSLSADVYLTTGGGLLKLMLGSGAARWDMSQAVEPISESGGRVHLMAAIDLDNTAYFAATPSIYLMGKITVDGTLRVGGPIGFQYQLLRSV